MLYLTKHYLSSVQQDNLLNIITEYIPKMRKQFAASNFKDPYRHLSIVFPTSSYQPLIYGTNCDRVFHVGQHKNVHRHAEMDALAKLNRKANIKRRNTINVLVIRLNRQNELCNSEPCKFCIAYMYRLSHYNIKYVYYSTADRKIVRQLFSELCDIIKK